MSLTRWRWSPGAVPLIPTAASAAYVGLNAEVPSGCVGVGLEIKELKWDQFD